jgi:hypothetical protein
MTMPNTVMNLHPKSQLAVLEFLKQCFNMYNSNINIRERMREIDLTYAREKNQEAEQKRAKQSNRYGSQSALQDFTIPTVMPQVEAAVVYQTSVFLQGVPIFGVAPTPTNADDAMAMEAVMAENATRGGWVRELMMGFRDGFKYNLFATEVKWERKVTAALETDINFGDGKQGKPKNVNWEGNSLKRLDLYNTFFDTRVSPTRIHEDGEFAGYNELMSRVKLKKFISELPDKIIGNVTKAFESGVGGTSTGVSSASGIANYYIPDINLGGGLTNGANHGMNWMSWAGLGGTESKIKYKNMYKVTTLYARIMPADFDIKVPAANTPQVWKFIVVNDSVVLYAERQTNAHGFIPILFAQPYEDGLTYQTKSLAKNVEPIQDISSSLMNSVLAARRRALSDRGLYDPSRVTEANINSMNPSAKIPVRPSAYGKPLSEAYYSIPFRDDQSPLIMQQIGAMGQFADKISGSNPARQGQFVKGNKTQHEFDSVMNSSNGRDQMTSLLLEAQLFTPMKEMLKINILQYQGAGSVYNPEKQQSVQVDPVALRKAVLEFKISDGLTPTDKLVNSDVMMVAMQQIGSSPQIGAGYNIAPLFSYLMKTQGADLKAFEKGPEQQAYEQAMGQYQEMCLQMAKANKEIKPEQFPPAPKPADYGYQPQGSGPPKPANQQAVPQ